MSNPTWPGSLPQLPLGDSYEEGKGPNTIRTSMDVGEKLRRRFTATQDPHKMIFEMDVSLLATFDTFYVTTLLSGSLPFDLAHPRTGVMATWTFHAEPKYINVGGPIWQVACDLLRKG